MKKLLKKLTLPLCLSICMALAGCGDNSDSGTETDTKTSENSTKNQKDKEKTNEGKKTDETGLSVPLTETAFSVWDGSTASFKNKVLTLKNGSGGNGAGFSLGGVNASDYKYAKFSYENLDVANVTLRLSYSDGSYSQTSLQKHLSSVFIELDKDRKSNITGLFFISREKAGYIGAEDSSFTVKALEFTSTKDTLRKDTITDSKTSGKFDDSVTALQISEKLAFGLSLGSGLNRCPFYKSEKTKYAGFGFQNNFRDDASKNEWEIPLTMNLEDQKTALGNQAGGMAFELSETPLVTKEFIHSVKEKGFKSIRICVTWFPHIIDNNYTIDPYFMERVKEVTDWSLSEGLYVLLNEHHSVHDYCTTPDYACGYNLTKEAMPESEKYLKAVYEQVCKAFNGSYDEGLIFEILNEPRIIRKKDKNDSSWDLWAPRGRSWSKEECLDDTGLEEATAILNEYNQLIVDTIRSSGGNNAKRFIMIPTYATDWSTVASEYLKLPEDSAKDKLMVAIHWYPLGFNDADNNQMRNSYTDETRKAVLKEKFETVFKASYDRFISKGVPVTITEFGIENDDCLGTFENRTKWFESASSDREERKECLSDFCQAAGKYGLSMMAWDDGCVHSVVKRLAPYAAYDGDDFIKAMISSYEKGLANPYTPSEKEEVESEGKLTLSGESSLDDEAWGKSCQISGSQLKGISQGKTLIFSLKKLSEASYSVIRVCPKGSDISLEMKSLSGLPEGSASLIESGSNGISDGKGMNISLSSDSSVTYTLTESDCSKITAAGGLSILGYGVKIEAISLSK